MSVILPSGFAYVELFDGVDEWEFQESFDRPVQHDTGADVASLTYFRDYRRVSAVLRPFAQEERKSPRARS
ncbi:MAG: hypothetical protein JJD97_16385 [Gemmatimonadaceae bacterium]|nr:hypothetical protein [Gemmatimonadaceae bacterium]